MYTLVPKPKINATPDCFIATNHTETINLNYKCYGNYCDLCKTGKKCPTNFP